MSPEDAMEKFRRGADLVQLITGMIFEGPSLIKRICKKYATEQLMATF
jgi:dihydroorotate dehydrogenase